MKSYAIKIILLGITLNVSLLSAYAQTLDVQNQLFLVDEVVANPAFIEEYEAGVREFFNQANLHHYPYNCFAWQTLDYHYIYLYSAKDHAEVDQIIKSWDSLIVDMGAENWEKISMHWSGSYEQVELYVVRSNPKLSYLPENPRLDQQEVGFSFWDYYHIIPGKEKEMNDLLIKWSQLLEEKNVKARFIIATGDRGIEMPVYIIQTFGKDVVDFWSYNKDMWELLGSDGEALYKKMISLLRKRNFREFHFRPDLSYLPDEK